MGFIIELTFPQKGFFQNKIIRVLRILLQRNYKLISCWAWARLPWSIRFYSCWVRFVFYSWEILKLLNKEERNFILFPVCCDIIWMTRNLITRQSEREVLDPTLSSRKINYIYASHILSCDCASEEKPRRSVWDPIPLLWK